MPLHSGKFHPNQLLYAVYMFVFLRVDPETTQVHHPNPNHVGSVWIGQCSLLADFWCVSKQPTFLDAFSTKGSLCCQN